MKKTNRLSEIYKELDKCMPKPWDASICNDGIAALNYEVVGTSAPYDQWDLNAVNTLRHLLDFAITKREEFQSIILNKDFCTKEMLDKITAEIRKGFVSTGNGWEDMTSPSKKFDANDIATYTMYNMYFFTILYNDYENLEYVSRHYRRVNENEEPEWVDWGISNNTK